METKKLASYPSGRIVSLINDILINRDRIDNLPQLIKKVSHGSSVQYDRYEEERKQDMISYYSSFKKREIDLEIVIVDIEKITESSRRLLNILWMIMSENSISNGRLIKTDVSISLNELVDVGLYANVESARKAVKRDASCLIGKIHFQGSITYGKKKMKQDKFMTPFIDFKIKRNKAYFKLNEDLNYEMMFPEYTKVPFSIYMHLGIMAGDMLIYILQQARQNIMKISNGHPFNVKMSTLALKMGLPLIDDTKNPKRDIMERLRKCIEDVASSTADDIEIAVHPEKTFHSSVEWIEESYISVKLKNEYRDYFQHINTKTASNGGKTASNGEKIATDGGSQPP